LAKVLNVHPTKLLIATFLTQRSDVAQKELLQQIDTELEELGVVWAEKARWTRPPALAVANVDHFI
jgi:hypothetical protein